MGNTWGSRVGVPHNGGRPRRSPRRWNIRGVLYGGLALSTAACGRQDPPEDPQQLEGRQDPVAIQNAGPSTSAEDRRHRPRKERREVRVRQTEERMEIWVTQEGEFPIRALPALLFVGDRVFQRSTYPTGSPLNTLIFFVSHEDFAGIPADAAISVAYGRPAMQNGRSPESAPAELVDVAVRGGAMKFGRLSEAKREVP